MEIAWTQQIIHTNVFARKDTLDHSAKQSLMRASHILVKMMVYVKVNHHRILANVNQVKTLAILSFYQYMPVVSEKKLGAFSKPCLDETNKIGCVTVLFWTRKI